MYNVYTQCTYLFRAIYIFAIVFCSRDYLFNTNISNYKKLNSHKAKQNVQQNIV